MTRRVVLIGAGEAIERDAAPERARDAVGLMAEAAEAAAADAGVALASLDGRGALVAIAVLGWRYGSEARALSERLGRTPARELDTSVGGNSPQSVVNELARRVRAGELSLALVAGGEAIRSRRRARRPDGEPPWEKKEYAPGRGHERLGVAGDGVHPRELRHGLFVPPTVYPLFENALAARLGRRPDAHRAALGRLYARLNAVAADNPFAWFPKRYSAEELVRVTPDNRMIAWPYTKRLNAVMEVNQAAAVLVASEDEARRLGVPESRWVDFHGGADAVEQAWYVTERPRLDACPAQADAIAAALAAAGTDAAGIDVFDLYSCFPVAVELAVEALGLAEDDPRPLTLTGGLAFGGGPGNAYSLQAIAKAVAHLRAHGGRALVTALGWYLTKHAAGVYGIGPAPAPRPEPARRSAPAIAVADAPEGEGVLETFTVLHARDGAPERGVVVGRLEDGRRFIAHTPADAALLEALERDGAAGQRGRVSSDEKGNLFRPQ